MNKKNLLDQVKHPVDLRKFNKKNQWFCKIRREKSKRYGQ